MIKIITTVGTSIITNYTDEAVSDALTNSKLADTSIKTAFKVLLKGADKDASQRIINKVSDYFLFNMQKEITQTEGEFEDGETIVSWKYDENVKSLNLHCSAEVYSISEIIKQNPDETFEVALVITDTAIAKVAAELIELGLKGIAKIAKVDIKPVKDLQVENGKALSENGFNNLIKCYDDIIKTTKSKDKKAKFVLNITGGYKGIIPLSTIYGLVSEISLNYIYEDSKSLIVLENIPITFDWTVAEMAGPYLDPTWFFTVKKDTEVIKMLQHYGFVDNKKDITPLGFLLKKVIDENYPEGKETLGMLAEYKLFEYYCNHDKVVRENYRVSRSILINDKPQSGEKGNEIDILLETDGNSPIYISNWVNGNKKGVEPVDQQYITNEIKGFFQVKNGSALVQFEAFLDHLLTYWKETKPIEIRYITWHLLKVGTPSNAENAIKDTLKKMQDLVEKKLGDKNLFKPYLLTIPINLKKDNVYVNMMQKQIKEHEFKLIKL